MELKSHFTDFFKYSFKYIKYQKRKSYVNCPIPKF